MKIAAIIGIISMLIQAFIIIRGIVNGKDHLNDLENLVLGWSWIFTIVTYVIIAFSIF